MSEKIKIGIIGTGSIAVSHIEAYRKNPDVELYAFCDINPERLAQMGEKYGITRLFTEKEEMLKLRKDVKDEDTNTPKMKEIMDTYYW